MAQAGDSTGYWRKTLQITGLLGALWLVVTLAVPWFAQGLPGRLLGFPFGYWLAAQGALLVFLGVVWVYALWMERLDAQHSEPAPTDDAQHAGR